MSAMHGGFSILPLRVDGLGYAVRGRPLVDGISFEIGPGSRTIIMGPNGAGKSLTLRLCHGLIQPTSGSIRWSAAGQAGGRRRHAMVFQRPVMLRRSVLDMVDAKQARLRFQILDDRAWPGESPGDSASVQCTGRGGQDTGFVVIGAKWKLSRSSSRR